MKKETENKKVEVKNADQKKAQKPTPQKPQAVLPSREVVTLAVTLGKVAKCLLMCAPQFPAGSEGAVAIELARKSILAVREILRPREIKDGGGA